MGRKKRKSKNTTQISPSEKKIRAKKRNKSIINYLNWQQKKKWTQCDFEHYDKAVVFEKEILSMCFVLIGLERNLAPLPAHVSLHHLLKTAFNIEFKKPRPERYILNLDEKQVWINIAPDLIKTYEKINDRCPICLENFQFNLDSGDWIRELKCGHHIHTKCEYKQICAQRLHIKMKCSLCRNYDKDSFWNKWRLERLASRPPPRASTIHDLILTNHEQRWLAEAIVLPMPTIPPIPTIPLG